MWQIVLIGLTLLWSIPATAEPAFVQSGEHVGFTRLVTKVAGEGRWHIEQKDRKVTLRLEGHSDGFDTSRVFDLIPRDRVERIESDRGALTLYLGCDCRVSAFDVQGGHLAVDIISPERSTRPPSASKPRSLRAQAPSSVPTKSKPLPLPMNKPMSRDALNQTEQAVLSGLQLRLSGELSSATTRGILRPNLKVKPAARTQIDPTAFEHLLPTDPPHKNVQHMSGNIRITTSMDVPDYSDPSEQALSDQGFWCPPDDATNVAGWGDTRSFDVQISEARANLFGELDQLDPDAAIILAKRYLYFGFGAEARQVLSLDPSLATKQQMLIDLAEIVETAGSTSNLAIQSFADCPGNVSLWAFLNAAPDGNKKAADPINLLRELNKLPVHLRQYIAPILSNSFLLSGDTVSAATALRNLERLPDALLPSATLAQAHVAIKSDNTTDGTSRLQDVATANVAESPYALVSLVSTKIDKGEPIDEKTVGLIEAYAHELRDTDLGPDLHKALVFALIETLDFDRALIEINAFSKSNPDKLAIELNVKLAQKLTKTASDIVFLDVIFRQLDSGIEPLDQPTKLSVASRLLSLGFALKADEIIESIPDRPRDPERQVLAAKIAIGLNQPFQALADLVGLNDQASDMLRAQAKSMTGAHEEAHEIYQTAGKKNAAHKNAWLAANWRELTPTSTPVFGQVRALAMPVFEPSDDQIGMLSRTTAVLEESGAARQTIAEFLTAPVLSTRSE